MFPECNNHEAHGPTDYHVYINFVHTCTYVTSKKICELKE